MPTAKEEQELLEDAPTPSETLGSTPSEVVAVEMAEDMDEDEVEGGTPFVTDPTPGAVTSFTPKASTKSRNQEEDSILPVGTWVKLADTEAVEEQGGRPGDLAVVLEAPVVYVDFDDNSPRKHPIANEDLKFLVRTRDERSVQLSLDREDFATVGRAGRSEVLPVG
jgi:hypothetical protein